MQHIHRNQEDFFDKNGMHYSASPLFGLKLANDFYIAPIERSAKLRESSERRDYGHEKTMDRQGKARDSA